MTDRQTLDVYDARATDYAKLVTSGSEPDEQLSAFLNGLKPQSYVLDIGCGPGHSAAHMAKAGHHVIATDASARMVALAAAQPGVTARQETFEDIAGTELYHGIWANFSLLHAARADLPRYLAALAQALRPDGLFHIGMKTGTATSRDTLGRRYTYVTETELNGLLRAAGLRPIRTWTGSEKGLDGEMAPWIIIQARKT